MPEIKNEKPAFKVRQNAELLQYWMDKRGEQMLPLRSDFNPMAIPKHLPYLIMLEPEPDYRMRIRLFGTELARALGADITGGDLMELYRPEERAGLRALIDTVAPNKAVSVVLTTWTTPTGYQYPTENLWLPLASDDGKVSRFLGSIRQYEVPQPEDEQLGGSVSSSMHISERQFFQV